MKETNSPQNDGCEGVTRRSPSLWLLAAASLLILLVALLLPKPDANQPSASSRTNSLWSVSAPVSSPNTRLGSVSGAPPTLQPAPTAEQIVARKLTQFSKSRRDLVHSLAKHFKLTVPDEIERFFDAAEAGRYEEMEAIYKTLRKERETGSDKRWYGPTWRAVVETAGAAEAAHDWPAQKLLDYGEAVLGSLRPGMIYAGGTDPGCFIPTFLNETTEGERHITLTQNALADGTYLDYLNFLHGDRMNTLTQDDSQHAFQDYLTDAQKRLRHDQDFPDEPKQLRPGEDVRITDGRVQVSGQVAVMAINERLFQMLMDKNPDASFAIEQSFPFASMYSGAIPLGPIMELRVPDAQSVFTAERAAQSVDYWRATAQQLISDPQTPEGSDPRKAYSKLVSEQAALLLDHKYTAEAEQALRIANEICPYSPEAVFRYVQLLMNQNRADDAIVTAQNAVTSAPDNPQFRDLLEQLKKMKK